MTSGGPTKVIAASLGLSAFAVAVIAGLAADNPAGTILARALVSMAVCHAVGWGIGAAAERAAQEAVRAYEAAAGAGAGAVGVGPGAGAPRGGEEVKGDSHRVSTS